MQEPLLSDGRDEPSSTGIGVVECLVNFSGCSAVFLFFVFTTCLASLSPNEYGITRNYITGSTGSEVIRGGLHFTGPFKGFVAFPAAQASLLFSNQPLTDRPAVRTRTGADPHDPDSGGQPIAISCALQYQFIQSELRTVYLSFGSYDAARQRFLLLAGNMVGNAAQEFTPQDFWQRRDVIAERMLKQINHTLWTQGHVMATRFEIMKVDFAQQFEDSITAVQVAEQSKVVNEYEQQVQRVVQEIFVMKSENEANIANISAGANAKAKEIRANAQRDAFNLKQQMKAKRYAELKGKLGLTQQEMFEYFKIKSVQAQNGGNKVVVGMPNFAQPTLPTKEPSKHGDDL